MYRPGGKEQGPMGNGEGADVPEKSWARIRWWVGPVVVTMVSLAPMVCGEGAPCGLVMER